MKETLSLCIPALYITLRHKEEENKCLIQVNGNIHNSITTRQQIKILLKKEKRK